MDLNNSPLDVNADTGFIVELQVKCGDDGREARKAYTGMGMHALRRKERCRTYASVSNPAEYEFWATDEYVVTSGWDERRR